MTPPLAAIDTWIFDLDNTLYPASTRLFDLIDARMTAFIAARLGLDAVAARAVQKEYFRAHGTTLAELMVEHAVDPHEFLDFVHDIALERVTPDAELVALVAALPGRKLVFTNGDAAYAGRVLAQLGFAGEFAGLHDIHAMALAPKPVASAYTSLCAAHEVVPAHALFVDDMARNLEPAKALGMTTVWLDNGSEQAGGAYCPSFVDLRIAALKPWLQSTLEDLA